MSSQTVNIPRDTTLQDTNDKLQAIAEIIGGNPMIAEKFSTGSSYAAGEYCINDGEFEKFTADKSAGAWDASKATETTVGEELTQLNSTLAGYGVRTLSNLGLTTPCTVRQIVNALPNGCCVVISISSGLVSDANYTGELYIRKATDSNVIHKTDLVIRTNASATTSLDGHYLIGMLPGTGNTVWYKPTLTAV